MKKYIQPALIILIAFLIVGSCNGSGGSNTTTRTIGPEGGTIKSADGKLTLEIPAGALTEDTEITIARLKPEDLPPELEGSDPDCAYELSPDGLQFLLPVTVSIMLNEKPLQEDGSFTSPTVIIATTNNDVIEVLDNLNMDIDGDANTIIARGETTHFSPYTTYTIEPNIRFDGVPNIGIMFDIPFTFQIEINLSDNVGVLSDPTWTDLSQGLLPNFAKNLPLSLPSKIKIPGFCGPNPETCNRHFIELTYDCPSPIRVTNLLESLAGQTLAIISIEDPGDALDGVQAEISHNLIKNVNCLDPDQAPDPPPPPPVVPVFGAIDIDGTWNFDCSVISEAFPLIDPNLGDPFSFQADLIVIPETLQLMILPLEDIFTLDGILVPQPNGDFSFNGGGSGFLSENPGPNDANIQIEAEDWNFSLDVPNSFSGEPQPGDIFADGVLRFNFPTLPLDNQSSLADCVGNKTGE